MSYDENKITNYMSEIKKIEEINSIKECSLFDITFDNGIIKKYDGEIGDDIYCDAINFIECEMAYNVTGFYFYDLRKAYIKYKDKINKKYNSYFEDISNDYSACIYELFKNYEEEKQNLWENSILEIN